MAGSLTGCVCCAGVDIIFANTVTQLPQGRPYSLLCPCHYYVGRTLGRNSLYKLVPQRVWELERLATKVKQSHNSEECFMQGEMQDSFFLSSPQDLFRGSRSNCIECTQRFPCTVKQCKAIGFLSFSFPEHFPELETKPRSQLGWHLFRICNVNRKKVREHALNPALTLPLFNYWLALTHFWPIPATLSRT